MLLFISLIFALASAQPATSGKTEAGYGTIEDYNHQLSMFNLKKEPQMFYHPSLPKDCGQRDRQYALRINGPIISHKQNPAFATIEVTFRHPLKKGGKDTKVCGGINIGTCTFLTAASCFYPHGSGNWTKASLKLHPEGSRIIASNIDRVCTHKGFKYTEDGIYLNDLAVIKLAHSRADDAKRACITAQPLQPGVVARASGMGLQAQYKKGFEDVRVESEELRDVTLNISSNCKHPFDNKHHICGKSTLINGGATCEDDEGGPVYRVVNNRIYVYGVITPRQDMAKCAWRSSPQIAATSLYNNEEELSNMLNSCEGACDNMYYS